MEIVLVKKMKYYTLKSNYALRGWSDKKYAILDLECTNVHGKVIELTKLQFDALELITAGGISAEEKIIPEKIRKMASWAADKGYLVECDPDHRLFDYQKYHYSEARYTHTLLWSVTGNCNLKCKHCYITAGENCYGELSLEQCDEVIRQCLEANVNMVALTGGEPLVRRDFWQIVDHLLENHIKILQVFTNGMLVSEKFMNEFDSRNIAPNYFMISFDGVGCHDWLRGVNGAEKKAIEAIKLIKGRGYRVTVSMSLHMGNIDSLLDTYELMKQLEVDHWKAAPIVDTGNWKNQGERNININKVFEENLRLIKKYMDDDMPMRLGLGGFFQGYDDKKSYKIPFISGCGNCDRCSQTLCEATMIFPYLLPNGKVLPCIAMSDSELKDIAPNIFDDGESMEKALCDSAVDKYIYYTYSDLFERNPECAACEHKYICSGCRANSLACGGYFEKDPLACHFIKGGYEQKITDIVSKGK